MASQSLPVSRLVKVTVQLNPQAAQAPALNQMLILGTSDTITITERWRLYSSITEVGDDFGDSAPEYLAAALWFEQVPQPSQLYIGRYASGEGSGGDTQSGSKGQLIGGPLSPTQQALSNFTGITAGSFHIQFNQGNPAADITSVDLSDVTNLNGVAAAITSAMAGAVVCTWNSVYNRFELMNTVEGPTSTISFASAPTGSGTDLSALMGLRSTTPGAFLSEGIDPETPVQAAILFDNLLGQRWFGLAYATAAPIAIQDSEVLAVAAFIEASDNYHFFGVTTQDANTLLSTSTTDLASMLKAAQYTRTAIQFSSTNAYAAVSMLARILTTDYTQQNSTITLMYKQEPGIVPEQLNTTQATVLESKNCNSFAAYNNDTAIIQDGVTCAGAPMYIDTQLIAVNYATSVQSAVFGRLYGSNKVGQDDAGTHQLVTDIEAVSAQFVLNGALAPGVWDGPGFGSLNTGDYMPKGYYVFAPPVATQNSTDRANRISVPIQVAAKLKGAIQKVNIAITLGD